MEEIKTEPDLKEDEIQVPDVFQSSGCNVAAVSWGARAPQFEKQQPCGVSAPLDK